MVAGESMATVKVPASFMGRPLTQFGLPPYLCGCGGIDGDSESVALSCLLPPDCPVAEESSMTADNTLMVMARYRCSSCLFLC